jgi:hypothetical protein
MLQIPGLPDLGIKVDYSKKVGEIYTEFATACLEKGDSLEFFSLLDGAGFSPTGANRNPRDNERMPSWVPDFSAEPNRRIGVIEGQWYASGNKQGFFWPEGAQFGISPDIKPFIANDGLLCIGFVAEIVDGVEAISKKDMEHGKFEIPDHSFKTGVVQPTADHAAVRSSHDISDELPDSPGWEDWENWDKEELNARVTVQNEKIQRVARAAYAAIDPQLHWVIVGGADISGAKTTDQFECLYEAFSGTLRTYTGPLNNY